MAYATLRCITPFILPLLSSVVNWQPGGGQSAFGSLFSSMMGFGKDKGGSTLSLNPGLLGLLSDSRDPTS